MPGQLGAPVDYYIGIESDFVLVWGIPSAHSFPPKTMCLLQFWLGQAKE